MNKLSTVAYGVIALVVVVILIFTIAIPVIEDAQTEQKSTANNVTDRYIMATNVKGPIELTLSADGHIIVNGVEEQPFYSNSMYVITETVTARVQHGDSYVFSCCISGNSARVDSNKLVFNNNELSLYNGDTLISTHSASYFLYPDNKGTYIQVSSDNVANININNNAQMFAIMAGINAGLFSGHLNDMVLVTENPTTSGASGHVYSSGTITLTSVENEDGLTYKLSSLPSITFSGEDLTDATAVGPTFVPLKYDYISQNDSMIITLLGVIPLMLVIVPVMLAVQLMTGGRRD